MRPGLLLSGFFIALDCIDFKVNFSLNNEKLASYKNIRSRNVQMTFLSIIMPLNSCTYIKNVGKRAFVWSVLVWLIFRRIFIIWSSAFYQVQSIIWWFSLYLWNGKKVTKAHQFTFNMEVKTVSFCTDGFSSLILRLLGSVLFIHCCATNHTFSLLPNWVA